MKYNPIKKILILVTILAVPGFLYYLLQEKGKNRYRPLSIFGPKQIAKTFHSVRGKQVPDTIYHVLPNFNLVNQNGTKVNWETYKGKIVLFNLFYTKGNTPGMQAANQSMAKFAQSYANNSMVHFVGLTIDPSTDQPAQLQQYLSHENKHPAKWDLLTGDTATVKHLIGQGLLLDAVKTMVQGQPKFTFSNMFVLVDTEHRIRGYYEATNAEALSKLDDEIKVLIAEELRNVKDGR
ncbi:MAG: SCO family protein [Pedobacter sp.]|nr:SCO family protein [Pedobacter sp.]MDQ8053030.1 SCO family protein [Pedobacter sp.]